jgi:hypothetical protein
MLGPLRIKLGALMFFIIVHQNKHYKFVNNDNLPQAIISCNGGVCGYSLGLKLGAVMYYGERKMQTNKSKPAITT